MDIWFLMAYVSFAYWQFMAFLLWPFHNLTTKWLSVFLPAVFGVQKAQQTPVRSACFFRLMNYGEWCSLTICSNLMPTIIGQVIRFDYIVFVSFKKRKRLPIIYACHLGHGYIVSEMQGSEVSLQVALKWILQRGVAVATQSTSFFGCSNRPVDYK